MAWRECACSGEESLRTVLQARVSTCEPSECPVLSTKLRWWTMLVLSNHDCGSYVRYQEV